MGRQYIVLYNPLAGNYRGEAQAHGLSQMLTGALKYVDITQIEDFSSFFSQTPKEIPVIIAGGDGTLSRFANAIQDLSLHTPLYYFAVGSGNDFLRDIGKPLGGSPIRVEEYLIDLPMVTVNGKTHRFLNGIGYGIDGYCCEEADLLRRANGKRVNYKRIALKGLLYGYQPANATVTVDGVTYHYEKVWLAPTMNGRYFGGGIMPTPGQNRKNPEKLVSLAVMYGIGKWRALSLFPSMFKGNHVRHTRAVHIMTGHDITVRFDRPTALQIDGETVRGVTEYRVQTVVAVERAKQIATAIQGTH